MKTIKLPVCDIVITLDGNDMDGFSGHLTSTLRVLLKPDDYDNDKILDAALA